MVIFRTRKKAVSFRRINFAQAAVVLVVVTAGAALVAQVQFDRRRSIRRDRNFYGLLTVDKGLRLNSVELRHGQIVHGWQSRYQPAEPTLYYTRGSGIGRLMELEEACLQPCQRRYGMIGLGVGTLAAYGRKNDTIRFYEINPQVTAYSFDQNPYFTFLRDSPSLIEIVQGDARLSLKREMRETGSENYDVLIIDAFTSDAIPVHLLTQEAMALYIGHLRGPQSIIAFHISNRFLDLGPVISALAEANHLSVIRLSRNTSDDGERADWMLLARDPTLFSSERFRDILAPVPVPDPKMLWTDDYTNLYRVLRRTTRATNTRALP